MVKIVPFIFILLFTVTSQAQIKDSIQLDFPAVVQGHLLCGLGTETINMREFLTRFNRTHNFMLQYELKAVQEKERQSARLFYKLKASSE